MGDRVGDALASDVGGGSAGGFVHAEVESVVTLASERGRGQHAERAGDHCHFIREDVAEEVFGHQHIEGSGASDQLHRGVVDIHVRELHFGKLAGNFDHRLTPQHGGCEHICFVDREQLFLAAHRGGECDAGDALDLALFVNHRVERNRFAIFFVATFR